MNKSCLLVLLVIILASCDGVPGGNRLLPVRNGSYYGYIDRKGKTVIPFQYTRAGCFVGGMAVIATSENEPGWGYIDRWGKSVIKPVYNGATSFSDGLAFVVPRGGSPQAIDKNGIVKFSLSDAESAENFSEGLAAYSILGADGEIWGFVDRAGKAVIDPQYRAVSYFSSGLCGVMNRNGEWGYINKAGKMVIGFLFDNAYPFNGDRAKVDSRGKLGIIDKSGRFILPPRYGDVDIDGTDRYLVKHDTTWGWIAPSGGALIAEQFNDAYPFLGNKYAPVKAGGKWGFINEDGKFVIAPQYEFAFGFVDGLAVVQSGGKYGFINEAGKYVVQPAYDHLPVDYFIRYFAPASAYYSVKTDVNQPKNIAYRWLSGFYRLDYDEARKYATEDTRVLLDQFASVSDMISDSTKQQMAGVMIGIRGCRESGNRAIVNYTLSDNRGKEQMLFLIKTNGKWRVQFTKNDGGQNDPDEEPGAG